MIHTCQPPKLTAAAVFDLLLRLDAMIQPGLTVHEFMDLFVICNRCGLVMTRRVFNSHDCVLLYEGVEVIDLTIEE
jgi:hypothetical protein